MSKLSKMILRKIKASVGMCMLMLSFLCVLNASAFAVNFSYNSNKQVQVYTVPTTGKYKLEVWGAQGGNSVGGLNGTGDVFKPMGIGGKGGYAVGYIDLTAGQKLNIYVGGKGGNGNIKTGAGGSAGWNGGGKGLGDEDTGEEAPDACGGGGGATHIATTARGVLKNYKNYKSEVIIVAGGGGGAGWSGTGGTGGGNKGGQKGSNPPGTQTSGYEFGQGMNASVDINDIGSAGGRRRLVWWILSKKY